jgi:hypothetical protein
MAFLEKESNVAGFLGVHIDALRIDHYILPKMASSKEF